MYACMLVCRLLVSRLPRIRVFKANIKYFYFKCCFHYFNVSRNTRENYCIIKFSEKTLFSHKFGEFFPFSYHFCTINIYTLNRILINCQEVNKKQKEKSKILQITYICTYMHIHTYLGMFLAK